MLKIKNKNDYYLSNLKNEVGGNHLKKIKNFHEYYILKIVKQLSFFQKLIIEKSPKKCRINIT